MTAKARSALALIIGATVMGGCTPVVVRSSNPATKTPAPSTTPALAGSVKDATGAPVEGALVAAVSWKASDSSTPAALVHSDRAGRFAIDSLAAGRYSLTATAGGREGGFAGNIDVAPGQTRSAELVLGNGGVRLSGSVVDITGKPLSSLLVSFSRSSDEQGDVWYAYADERGQFAVTVPRAGYTIGAAGRGSSAGSTWVAAGAAGAPIVLELEPEDVDAFAGPKVLEGLRAVGVSLTTCDPAAELGEDLDQLHRFVGDARIVGLGEGTHGGHESFQLKHRLFRFLVEKMGFDVFAIEASWPDTLALDEYVHTGRGDPTLLVPRMRFWIWDTEEMVALVRWMRAYNASPQHPRKLSFVGFDMQNAPTSVAAVARYVARVDDAYGARLKAALADLGDEYEANHVDRWPAASRDQTRKTVAELLDAFDRNKSAWSRRTGVAAWDTARHHAEILSQFLTLVLEPARSDATRDRAMADNVRWIVEHQPADARIAVWAANLHVAKRSWFGGPPSMGALLSETYGNRYAAFATSFAGGSIRAVGLRPLRPIRAFELPDAPAGTVEGTLARLPGNVVGVDLAALTPQSDAGRWSRYQLRMRIIGSSYTEAWNGSMVPQHPGALYDAIFVVRHMTPSRYAGPLKPTNDPLAAPTNTSFETAAGEAVPGWLVNILTMQTGYRAAVRHDDCFEGSSCAFVSRPGPVRMPGYGTLSQEIDAAPFRGRRVRVRAAVRMDADVRTGGAQLFLQTEGANGNVIAAVNMFDRAVRTKAWGSYEVELDVGAASDSIRYGLAVSGDVPAWLDAVRIESVAAAAAGRR